MRTLWRRATALRVPDHPWFWIPMVATTLPLLVFAWSVIASDWIPHGDEAVMAIKAHDAWTGHPPLLGMRSTSDVTSPGVWAHHPGPLQFWIMGLPYLLSGFQPAGLVIGCTLIAIGFVAVSLWSAYRAADHLGVAIMTFTVLGTIVMFGDSLVMPWNPWPPVLGMLAMIAVGWRIMLDDHGWWPLYVFCASFVGQSHLSLLPIAVIVSGFLLGRSLLRRWRVRRRGLRRRPRWTEVRWAVAVGALCWLGPIMDVLMFSPHNVGEIWRLSGSEEGTAAGRHEGFVHLTYMLFPWDQRFREWLQVGRVGVLVLVLTAVVLLLAWRRHGARRGFGDQRDWMTGVLVLTTITVLVIGWAGTRTQGGIRVVYLDFAIAATILHTVLVFTWLALAALAWLDRREQRPSRAVVLGVAALVGAVGIVQMPQAYARIFTQQGYTQDNEQAREVVERVRPILAMERFADLPVTVRGYGLSSWLGVAPSIQSDLVASGRTVHFDNAWAYREDDDFRRIKYVEGDRVDVVVSERAPDGDWSFEAAQSPLEEFVIEKFDDGGQLRVQVFLSDVLIEPVD